MAPSYTILSKSGKSLEYFISHGRLTRRQQNLCNFCQITCSSQCCWHYCAQQDSLWHPEENLMIKTLNTNEFLFWSILEISFHYFYSDFPFFCSFYKCHQDYIFSLFQSCQFLTWKFIGTIFEISFSFISHKIHFSYQTTSITFWNIRDKLLKCGRWEDFMFYKTWKIKFEVFGSYFDTYTSITRNKLTF